MDAKMQKTLEGIAGKLTKAERRALANVVKTVIHVTSDWELRHPNGPGPNQESPPGKRRRAEINLFLEQHLPKRDGALAMMKILTGEYQPL